MLWETYKAPLFVGRQVMRAKYYASNRRLRFNRPLFEALGRPAAVLLVYDRQKHVIGLFPVPDDAEVAGLAVIREKATSDRWSVALGGFLTHFRLPTDHDIVFHRPTLAPDGSIVLGPAE